MKETKETLGQIVNRLMREQEVRRDHILQGAHISVPTLELIRKDRIPAVTTMEVRRRHKWVRSIVRTAVLFEQDPVSWLTLAGFPIKEEWVKTSIEKAMEARVTVVDERGRWASKMEIYPLTFQDLEFLTSVQKLMGQPLTLGLAYELLRRRSSPSPESKPATEGQN